MGCRTPGSSVHGISQTRIVEWVTISFSKGSSPPRAQSPLALAGGFFSSEPPGKPKEVWSSGRAGEKISGKLFFFALMIKLCSGPEKELFMKWFLCYYQHRFTFLGGIVTSFAPLCLFLEKRKSVVGCQNSSHNFAHYAIRFDLLSPIYWLRTEINGKQKLTIKREAYFLQHDFPTLPQRMKVIISVNFCSLVLVLNIK